MDETRSGICQPTNPSSPQIQQFPLYNQLPMCTLCNASIAKVLCEAVGRDLSNRQMTSVGSTLHQPARLIQKGLLK
jgi:hypothetical protein